MRFASNYVQQKTASTLHLLGLEMGDKMSKLLAIIALIFCVAACSGQQSFSSNSAAAQLSSTGIVYSQIIFSANSSTCKVDVSSGIATCVTNNCGAAAPCDAVAVTCDANQNLLELLDQTLKTIHPIPNTGIDQCTYITNMQTTDLFEGNEELSIPCNYTLNSTDQTNISNLKAEYFKDCGLSI